MGYLIFIIALLAFCGIGFGVSMYIEKKKKKVEVKQRVEQNVSVEPDPQMFQGVYDLISEHLPEKWDRLAVYYAVDGNMIDFKYYVDEGKGYIDCYSKKDRNREKHRELRFALDEILYDERLRLEPKKRWSVFTMFVYSSGKFETNFSYEDISENTLAYHQKWEKENIKNK